MNVLLPGPMTVKSLVAALLQLPDGAVVERVQRDDNEMAIAIGIDSTEYEADPMIDIRIRLPKTTRTANY